MGLFGNKVDPTIQETVDDATSDKSFEDNWLKIMNICDKAGKSAENARTCLKAVVRKLFNSDPHVGLKAVTVLDACVKNAGKTFHVEVASRDFETDFTKLMHKAHPHVAKKLREVLKRWAENEFKSDAQLNLIPTLYEQLKNAYDFSSSETPVKKGVPKSTDPNVVESQEEEDDILRAIELSLKETTGSPRNTNTVSTSLYPSVNNVSATTSSTATAAPVKEARKVRALYDFEAAEDNELTFSSGEIILILDDSDPNWWKGSNQRGEGLFPANFVTADLTVEPETFLIDKTKKMVQFKEEVKVLEKEPQEIEVNEDKIDRLLHLLHEADPTNPETDTDELLGLEREVNAMGPLIDSELERVDRKHAQLTQLSANLVEALALYHTLMREPLLSNVAKAGYDPTYGYIPPPNGMYNNMSMAGMPQPPPQHLGYQVTGQSSLPYTSLPIHQFPMPQHVVHSNVPPNTQAAMMTPMSGPGVPNIPQGLPLNQSPANFPPVMEDRRMEGAMMPPQFQHNLPPNYGHLNMVPPQFSNSGPASQTTIQNGPNQPPQFVSSSTHIMQ